MHLRGCSRELGSERETQPGSMNTYWGGHSCVGSQLQADLLYSTRGYRGWTL